MDWWIWILIGLFLVLAEVVTPGGFYILFFGVGALVVGFLGLAGLGGPAWLQVLLFSIISVAALWLFREKLLQFSQVKTSAPVDSFVGETARATEAIAINETGKAELRGTSWNARNVGTTPLASGARCTVERVEGLTLYVRAEAQ
jgi:membrane protein implicated in regulation of membrane protease activity